jgi:hypothetical protein
VRSPEYRASAADDDALHARLATVKMVSPTQLQGIIADITEYTWTFDGVRGLESHALGLPLLLGGIDGTNVTRRGYDPSVGAVFVQERLAQSASWHVARHDLDPAREDAAILLRFVTIDDTPDQDLAAFEQQIRSLYLDSTGHPLAQNASQVPNLVALWRQILSVEGDPEAAWAGVVSAVLRDPLVLTY